ncbi:hypothetical protein QYF36_008499 [Acer negundo]|nr:hypothetical protein QYF36_008499 [Acer negundo]
MSFIDEWRLANIVDVVIPVRNIAGDPIWRPPLAEAGLVPFQIEVDSLQAVVSVTKDHHSDADMGPIIKEISSMLRALPSHSISHIRRKGNVTTHALAKKALVVESNYRWIYFCPPTWSELSNVMLYFSVFLFVF